VVIFLEKTKINETLSRRNLDTLESLGGKVKYRKVVHEGDTNFWADGPISVNFNTFRKELEIDVINQWMFAVPVKNIVDIISSDTQVSFILKQGKVDLWIK
jgi:hypothetical protein